MKGNKALWKTSVYFYSIYNSAWCFLRYPICGLKPFTYMCAWLPLFYTACMSYGKSVCTIKIVDCQVEWHTKCQQYILALQVLIVFWANHDGSLDDVFYIINMFLLKLQEVFKHLSLTSSIMCNVARNGSQMDSTGSRPYIMNNQNVLFLVPW